MGFAKVLRLLFGIHDVCGSNHPYMIPRLTYIYIVVALAVVLVPYSIITYSHIGEDCFISFRYVENFVEGKGLVYNSGERVEGYSNFLWVMLLALLRFVGFGVINSSKVLGVLANALILIVVGLFFTERKHKDIPIVYLMAPLLVFFNPMLHYNSDRGLETCLYALLILVAVYYFVRRRYMASSFAFAAVALTRPEGFLYFWVLVPFFLIDYNAMLKRTPERQTIAPMLRFFLPYTVIFGVYILWRLSYYGYPFPNTVYAKTTPLHFWQQPSIAMLWQFIKSCSFVPLLALPVFLTIGQESAERRRTLFVLGASAAAVILYTLAIGDIFGAPFRHYVPMIPFVILLIQELLRSAKEQLVGRWIAIGLVCLVILGMNFYTYKNLDAPRTRLHVRTWEFLASWDFGARLKWYLEPPVFLGADVGRWMHEYLPADALLAVDQMGQLGYYSRHHIIDLIGLMDVEIAHRDYSTELLLRRNPDYVVLYAQNGVPLIGQLADTARDDRFRERYVRLYVLKANHPYDINEYQVFGQRTDHPDAQEKMLRIGLNAEAWNARWRV